MKNFFKNYIKQIKVIINTMIDSIIIINNILKML